MNKLLAFFWPGMKLLQLLGAALALKGSYRSMGRDIDRCEVLQWAYIQQWLGEDISGLTEQLFSKPSTVRGLTTIHCSMGYVDINLSGPNRFMRWQVVSQIIEFSLVVIRYSIVSTLQAFWQSYECLITRTRRAQGQIPALKRRIMIFSPQHWSSCACPKNGLISQGHLPA